MTTGGQPASRHGSVAAVQEGLHRVADFDLSIAMWGYDVAGDIAEVGATVSEWPSFETLTMTGPIWDRDEAWRQTIRLNGEPPPEHWCLPWITEWSMQREVAHVG